MIRYEIKDGFTIGHNIFLMIISLIQVAKRQTQKTMEYNKNTDHFNTKLTKATEPFHKQHKNVKKCKPI